MFPNPKDLVGLTYRDAWLASGGALKQKTPAGLESILENLGIDGRAIISNADDAWWVFATAGTYEPNSIHLAEARDVSGDGRFLFPVPAYLEREKKPGLLKRLQQNHPYLYKGLVVATVIGTFGLAAAAGFAVTKHASAQSEIECSAHMFDIKIDNEFNESRLMNDWERQEGIISYKEELTCPLENKNFVISVVSDGTLFDRYSNYGKLIAPKGAYSLSAAFKVPMGQPSKLIINETLVWQDHSQPDTSISYTADVSVPYPDKVVKWAVNNAPTLKFDSREKYLPADPYGDGDTNVNNNKENWPQKFTGRPVIFYSITDRTLYLSDDAKLHPEYYTDILESNVYVQYWTHYVWNEWRGTDKHKLDNELIVKEIDRQTGEVIRTSMSMHIWNNVYDGNISAAYVENGSHGMSKDGKSFPLEDFSTVGMTLTPSDYEIKPLTLMGKYYEQDFPGDRGKFPAEQERHQNPEKTFETMGWPTSAKFSIEHSPNLELVLKNPNVAAVQQGETIYAVNNIGRDFLDSIEFKTTGVRAENYRVKAEIGYKNGTKNAEVVLSIKSGQSQYFQAAGSGLNLDKDGDGVKETQISYSSGHPSIQGLKEKILVAGAAAGTAIAGILGFRLWRKNRKSL